MRDIDAPGTSRGARSLDKSPSRPKSAVNHGGTGPGIPEGDVLHFRK